MHIYINKINKQSFIVFNTLKYFDTSEIKDYKKQMNNTAIYIKWTNIQVIRYDQTQKFALQYVYNEPSIKSCFIPTIIYSLMCAYKALKNGKI